MCDTALSFVRDNLVPLARDHLLPLLKEAANMIRGVPKEIAELKDELESIENFINNADRSADAVEDKKIKDMIKQLIEASFHMEDVIDDYIFLEEQQSSDPGCAAGAVDLVKTKILRLQIAYKIQNIKSQICEIKDTSEKDHGFQIQSSSDKGSSISATNQNVTLLQNIREAPLYMDEADVVGFEVPRDKLICWLVEGRAERTVVSIVGMGGQGKTTLAKKVFDNSKVVKHFDCHVWIRVSQSFIIEELLRDMLHRFYTQQGDDPPQLMHLMDRDSLIHEVRNHLKQKRYFIVFDDVWNKHFWDEIEFAMIDNKNGSKILITTRKMNVANACKKSSLVEVHELKPLTKEQSLELFNKKTFRNLNGCCPENLIDISSKIIEKCNGLPLAIVVIGGLLSQNDRNAFQWHKFSEHLNSELKEHSQIKLILALSYHDLPYHLKSCLLYFGMYANDNVVKSKRLILQWIAEGFVKEDDEYTAEEVAEGYLTELIRRSLVQAVSINIDGRAKSCRVHDLVHAMILEKCDDLSFCKNITKDGQSSFSGIVRRLSIAFTSDNLMKNIESSQVRSLVSLTPNTLPESFVKKIPTKYKLLKVLAFENAGMLEVPEDLGSLIHLKYFSFREIRLEGFELPKSIGMLQHLETLDLKHTIVYYMPKEICKLRKLRHFQGSAMSLIQLKDGIGGMTSLQTLRDVYLDENEDENDNRVVELIKELGKLTQLRELVLLGVKRKYMRVISSSIDQMQQLEKLRIRANGYNTVTDMHLNSPPSMLRILSLDGKLTKLPEWVPKLQNLVKLKLNYSQLTDDIMKLLRNMSNLLSLSAHNCAYEGESLHFQDGWFKSLKELYLGDSENLNYILIDEGALCSLKKLELSFIPQLKTLPTGIQHLKKLDVLRMKKMSLKFSQSFISDGGKAHWSLKHVAVVDI